MLNGQPTLKPPVEVRLLRVKGQGHFVRVSVRSVSKPTSIMVGTLNTATFVSQADARKKVEVLAGALAERVAERLGDGLIDPDKCALEAGRLWDELLKKPESAVEEVEVA